MTTPTPPLTDAEVAELRADMVLRGWPWSDRVIRLCDALTASQEASRAAEERLDAVGRILCPKDWTRDVDLAERALSLVRGHAAGWDEVMALRDDRYAVGGLDEREDVIAWLDSCDGAVHEGEEDAFRKAADAIAAGKHIGAAKAGEGE